MAIKSGHMLMSGGQQRVGGAESINAYADTVQVARVMYCLCHPQLYNPPSSRHTMGIPLSLSCLPAPQFCNTLPHHPLPHSHTTLPHHLLPHFPHHPSAPPCALQSPVHHPVPHSCTTHPSQPPCASLLHGLKACPGLQCRCLEQQRRSIGRADQRAAGAGVNAAGGRGRGEAMLRQGGWQEGWHITRVMVSVVEACRDGVVTKTRRGKAGGGRKD